MNRQEQQFIKNKIDFFVLQRKATSTMAGQKNPPYSDKWTTWSSQADFKRRRRRGDMIDMFKQFCHRALWCQPSFKPALKTACTGDEHVQGAFVCFIA